MSVLGVLVLIVVAAFIVLGAFGVVLTWALFSEGEGGGDGHG